MKKLLMTLISLAAVCAFAGNSGWNTVDRDAILDDFAEGVSKGQLRLTAEQTTDLTATPGTYIAVAGTFSDGLANNFTISAAGVLTYTGTETMSFLLNGVSDLSSDKGARVTYGLYLNGVLVTAAQTPHDFAVGKAENISITSLIELDPDDYVQVFAKSDTANTTITVATLQVTLWGEK